MKKIILIIAVLLFIASPAWSLGVAIGAAAGVALGASAGAAIAGAAVAGAVVGAVVGGVVGGVTQNEQEKEKKTQYDANIASLRVQNESISSENTKLSTALDVWGSDYRANMESMEDQGIAELKNRKESWGLVDARLASQERGGITAQLLSQEAKNRVISYAGEDMELNSREVELAVTDAFNSTDTSSLKNLTSKNYGIYENSLISAMTSLMQNRRTLEEQIEVNKRAIETNKDSIGRYEKLKDELFFQ